LPSFAERLKKLRKERDIRQRDLAEVARVSRSAVAYWESGKSAPNTHTLARLADYFGVSTDYLMGRTDNPKPKPAPFDPTNEDWLLRPNCPSYLKLLYEEPDLRPLLDDSELRAMLVDPEFLSASVEIRRSGEVDYWKIFKRIVRYLAFELSQARQSTDNDRK